jgi:hypothetical protein
MGNGKKLFSPVLPPEKSGALSVPGPGPGLRNDSCGLCVVFASQ